MAVSNIVQSTTLLREATSVWKLLNGVVCIYKPQGISLRRTSINLRNKLCQDLNSMERIPRQDIIQIKRVPTNDEADSSENLNRAQLIGQIKDGKSYIQVLKTKSYSDHPLAVGRGYEPKDIKLQNGPFLAKESSGLTILGVNTGCKTADLISRNKWLATYIVSGQLGKGTNTFFHTGKVLEKARFHKIQKHMVDRILATTQATHQRLSFDAAGVPMDSERAYELASRGLVRPDSSSTSPLIYAVKCIKFDLPDFDLEISAINETEAFLWQIIHELGLKLHSVATCTKVRRVKIGPFDLDSTLLQKHWTLEHVLTNMNQINSILKQYNLYERNPTVEKF